MGPTHPGEERKKAAQRLVEEEMGFAVYPFQLVQVARRNKLNVYALPRATMESPPGGELTQQRYQPTEGGWYFVWVNPDAIQENMLRQFALKVKEWFRGALHRSESEVRVAPEAPGLEVRAACPHKRSVFYCSQAKIHLLPSDTELEFLGQSGQPSPM